METPPKKTALNSVYIKTFVTVMIKLLANEVNTRIHRITTSALVSQVLVFHNFVMHISMNHLMTFEGRRP